MSVPGVLLPGPSLLLAVEDTGRALPASVKASHTLLLPAVNTAQEASLPHRATLPLYASVQGLTPLLSSRDRLAKASRSVDHPSTDGHFQGREYAGLCSSF